MFVCVMTLGDTDLLRAEGFHAGAMWVCVMKVSRGTREEPRGAAK